ncbi:hypothetical protein CLOP_g6035 [Closterium sp. NIES-67]|nr:hypothetical protein CLOP_g6035 [Closterium sp. NIES-67]
MTTKLQGSAAESSLPAPASPRQPTLAQMILQVVPTPQVACLLLALAYLAVAPVAPLLVHFQFCSDCLAQNRRQHNNCPLCRSPLLQCHLQR